MGFFFIKRSPEKSPETIAMTFLPFMCGANISTIRYLGLKFSINRSPLGFRDNTITSSFSKLSNNLRITIGVPDDSLGEALETTRKGFELELKVITDLNY